MMDHDETMTMIAVFLDLMSRGLERPFDEVCDAFVKGIVMREELERKRYRRRAQRRTPPQPAA